ncbi:hypothetical protein QJS10_CPA03g02219 [Acorus calamus]|uniref:Uncharacterized protein n=1 Tax=Acorus calamus TaxID=4465 RepID=A0AAV9F6W5_ACOCL|nr:hypothetical protein QJS10_CPA03g02219 [Acorus calamus]
MKYGARMTLWEALHGRGDLYMTLVREATTALLNYYNSSPPLYPLDLILQMNKALLGPPRQALRIALDFKKSSFGGGVGGGSTGACSFSPCS